MRITEHFKPFCQQRLQSLADQKRLFAQNTNTARQNVPPSNSNKSPRAEVACTDSPDTEAEFFVGEDHSPDSQIR